MALGVGGGSLRRGYFRTWEDLGFGFAGAFGAVGVFGVGVWRVVVVIMPVVVAVRMIVAVVVMMVVVLHFETADAGAERVAMGAIGHV